MAPGFRVIETKLVRLWDFGWLDVTRLRVDSVSVVRAECADLIAQFFTDPISQRSFCSPGPWGEPIDRHGPFLRGQLTAARFLPVSLDELAARIHDVLDDPQFTDQPSEAQRIAAEALLEDVFARGDNAYWLMPIDDPDARVDWSFVWCIFHEFLCVSPDREELTVGVIGYD
jgi:hypothetical protein